MNTDRTRIKTEEGSPQRHRDTEKRRGEERREEERREEERRGEKRREEERRGEKRMGEGGVASTRAFPLCVSLVLCVSVSLW